MAQADQPVNKASETGSIMVPADLKVDLTPTYLSWQSTFLASPEDTGRVLVETPNSYTSLSVDAGGICLQSFGLKDAAEVSEFWVGVEQVADKAEANFVLYTCDDPQAMTFSGKQIFSHPVKIPRLPQLAPKSVIFTPEIPGDGDYEVFAKFLGKSTRADNAPVEIKHAGGAKVVKLNQRKTDVEWVSLGTYPFTKGTEGSVTISNEGANGLVAVDAIKYVRQGQEPLEIFQDNSDAKGVKIVGTWSKNAGTDQRVYGADWIHDENRGKPKFVYLRIRLQQPDGSGLKLPPGFYAFGFQETQGDDNKFLTLRRVAGVGSGSTGYNAFTGKSAEKMRGSQQELTFAVLTSESKTTQTEHPFKLTSGISRPSILIAGKSNPYGLRTLDDLRQDIQSGLPKKLWERIQAQIAEDKVTAPEDWGGKVSWPVAHKVSQRILRNALTAVLLNDDESKRLALEQIGAVYDPLLFPRLRDPAHNGMEIDLRGGTIAPAIALAYDWMYEKLTEKERLWLLRGLDARFIQPYLKDLESNVWWVNAGNNWSTVINGGFGVAGMALADTHPDARRLVEFSEPRMRKYLDLLGADGSFNETPFYANALLHPVRYFNALRFYEPKSTEVNPLLSGLLQKSCHWMRYAMLPPGRVMKFGDCSDPFLPLPFFPAVAQAAKDGVLQAAYLDSVGELNPRTDLVSELLDYDGRVKPISPEGVLPRGRAFEYHGKLISSRSSWDTQAPHSIAYGKAGREGHGANDVGQFCLDGFGQPLLITLGHPAGGYPADYFSSNRKKYYNASTWGQNLFMFDRQEQIEKAGKIALVGNVVTAEFDDKKGGMWQLDLTPVYEGAESVRRTVVHLLPDVAVVLDEAKLKKSADISLRWHTADKAEPSADGVFSVKARGVELAAKIVPLDGAKVQFQRGEHSYEAPFNMTRDNKPLNQPHESFIEVTTQADHLRLLSLFSVQKEGQAKTTWQQEGSGWMIETPDGKVTVASDGKTLVVKNTKTNEGWKVSLL